MPTAVSISNRAINRVGGNPIMSLDDDSVEANACKINFDDVRDIVLEEHQWSFAIARYLLPVAVVPNTTSDAGQYSNYFLKPANVLNIIRVASNPDDHTPAANWRLEGEYIVSNIESAYVKCVIQITDPKQFSAMFSQAMMLRLASEIAIPIAQSSNLQKSLMGEYIASVEIAAAKDGQQGSTQRIRSSQYIAARYIDDGGSYLGPYV